MKTEVAILHHEYPNAIRDHTAEKLQQLVKYYDGTVTLRAVLERQHEEHRVELVANVVGDSASSGAPVHADTTSARAMTPMNSRLIRTAYHPSPSLSGFGIPCGIPNPYARMWGAPRCSPHSLGSWLLILESVRNSPLSRHS